MYIQVCFKFDASQGTETRMSVHPNYNPNLCRFKLIVLAHDPDKAIKHLTTRVPNSMKHSRSSGNFISRRVASSDLGNFLRCGR
jgi:hypothetical protein